MTAALGKGTATHSSILAWRTPWTEEPGGYRPEVRRVGHDRSDLVCTHVDVSGRVKHTLVHIASLGGLF